MARPLSRSAATTAREVKVVVSRLRRRIRGLALTDDLNGSQAAVRQFGNVFEPEELSPRDVG